MKNRIDVSVIIPAYNTAEPPGSLVNNILSETHAAPELIVVVPMPPQTLYASFVSCQHVPSVEITDVHNDSVLFPSKVGTLLMLTQSPELLCLPFQLNR